MSIHRFFIVISLIVIVCLALAERVYNISNNPAGFFADEADIGYNAYTLLHFGTDKYGVPRPFFFRGFGDYRNPFPIYINIPAVAIFGLNEFSIRLTTAVAGSLTILFIFVIAFEGSPWKDSTGGVFAILTALLLATSPWHIHFSRFGSEYIYFPFLLSASWLLFIKGLKRPPLLLSSFFCFGITLYTYYPTWLVTPLFVGSLFMLYRKQLWLVKKYAIFGGLIFFICLLPLLRGIQNGVALTRWQNVAINKHSQLQVTDVFKNYLAHFSPTFLFTKGDIDYPGHFIRRFSSRGQGELYLWELPLVIIGVLVIVRLRSPFLLSVLALLALYPLGSTLANTDGGAPLAFRSIIGVLPFQFLAALGGIAILWFLKPKAIRVILFAVLIIFMATSTWKYLSEYQVQYPLYSSDFWGWQFGPRDVMKYFLSHQSQYDDLFLMGNFNSPEIFINFYDPTNQCRSKCAVAGLEKFDPLRRQLYAIETTRLAEIPPVKSHTILATLPYPNGDPAFYIITFSSNYSATE